MVTLGVAATADKVPEGFELVELQFEKSVPRHVAALPKKTYTIHAPYYGTIATEKEQKVKDAQMRILDAANLAKRIGSRLVITHAGFYAKKTPEETFLTVKRNASELVSTMGVPLGIETQSRHTQFGSLDEVLRLSKEVRVTPVLNLPAIQQRDGALDIGKVLASVAKPYCHFDESIDLKTLAYAAKRVADATLIAENENAALALSRLL
jgi:hypothetical protein